MSTLPPGPAEPQEPINPQEVVCQGTVELGPDGQPMMLLQFATGYYIGIASVEQAEGLAQMIHGLAQILRDAQAGRN